MRARLGPWPTTTMTTGPSLSATPRSSGRPPGGGIPTWNAQWLRVIEATGQGRENAPKYIAYALEARRKAGLPELEGAKPPVPVDERGQDGH